MNAAYQTLIVKFSEPIKVLDGIFDDAEAWGVDTLKAVSYTHLDVYKRQRRAWQNFMTAFLTSLFLVINAPIRIPHSE